MRWVLPPDGFFLDRNIPKLQYVPVLIESDGGYPVEANRYLVERSCGEWAPGTTDDSTIPTLRSRQNIASRLCAFFYWCDQKPGRDWRHLSYAEDLLGEYQVGLLDGSAAAKRKALQPSTANLYLDEATSFLTWAAERELRPAFKVHKRPVRIPSSSGAHSHSGSPLVVDQRVGKLREAGPHLDWLPLPQEVELWIKDIRNRHPIKALIFELMVRTGCRISEANQLRLACFPRKSTWADSWLAQGWIPIDLRWGVKGGKVHPSSQRSTKTRRIEVPVELADRIEQYLIVVRPNLLQRFHGDSKDQRTDRMWLGEHKSQPVSYQMLYKVWTGSSYSPAHWNPHASRHFFAVEKICDVTRDLLRFHQVENPAGVSLGWLHGLMAGQIRLILSPLLGHVSEATTMGYLRCAQQRMIRSFGHPAIRWNELLDEDVADAKTGDLP